jgi:bifunctional UDP-N-acetylglucosamine pyrophosphorylase/glucosamine-1-phosphate N-acetyltransferase
MHKRERFPPQRSASLAPLRAKRVTARDRAGSHASLASGPKRTVPIVLAAGLGTRMRSRTPKLLHPICGRPMLAYVVDAARSATGATPLIVTSPQTASVRAAFEGQADFALQDEPRGTGDAVRAALAALPDDVGTVLVLNGDVPLIEAEDVDELVRVRQETSAPIALLTVDANDPSGLGRVVRDLKDRVVRIVEEKDATAEQRELAEINVGIYAFDVEWLRRRLPDVPPSPVSGEFYLTHLIELARADQLPVAALMLEDDGTLLGINDRVQLAETELDMRARINERHMRAGVTMLDPGSIRVDSTVEIAEDVILEGGVTLVGTTRIGRDSEIRRASYLVNATIGERCVVWASVIEDSEVEDGVRVGPFAHVRGGSHIEADVELGNYAEVKASRIGRGSKQHHFSYIGDATLGERVNVGAGTITANYDGVSKHKTTIGDRAFIGSDTILRAPVTVGEGAYTGAGAVVTRDVPAPV